MVHKELVKDECTVQYCQEKDIQTREEEELSADGVGMPRENL